MRFTFDIEAETVGFSTTVAAAASRVEDVEHDAFDLAQRAEAFERAESASGRVWARDKPLAERRRVGETLKSGVQVAVVAEIVEAHAGLANTRPAQVKASCCCCCHCCFCRRCWTCRMMAVRVAIRHH